jgi:hypothetical protein
MRTLGLLLLAALVVATCATTQPGAPTIVPEAPAPTPIANQPVGDGWALSPLEPVDGFAEAARARCLADMAADPALPLVVQDQRRDDLAALLFADGTEEVEIVVERLPDGSFACGGGGGGDAGQIDGLDLGITSWTNVGDDAMDAWLVTGYVTDRATDVRITLQDGREIAASVGTGRFVAMWQGPDTMMSLRALDAGGGEVARVDDEFGLGGDGPEESLLVTVQMIPTYDPSKRTMTFQFRASDRGIAPGLGTGWVLKREPAAAYWEYLGPAGSGEGFAETPEATLTVPCEDLRFGDPGEERSASVFLDYRAGQVERHQGLSSESMTAMGSWMRDLPACPAAEDASDVP